MKVSKKVAKLAKEKGFNLPVFYFYEEGKIHPYEYNLPCKVDVVRIHQIKGENFNSKSHSLYCETISVPTQDDLRKWLREKHNINISIDSTRQCHNLYKIVKYDKNLDEELDYDFDNTFKKYEDCLEFALYESLKLINLS